MSKIIFTEIDSLTIMKLKNSMSISELAERIFRSRPKERLERKTVTIFYKHPDPKTGVRFKPVFPSQLKTILDDPEQRAKIASYIEGDEQVFFDDVNDAL